MRLSFRTLDFFFPRLSFAGQMCDARFAKDATNIYDVTIAADVDAGSGSNNNNYINNNRSSSKNHNSNNCNNRNDNKIEGKSQSDCKKSSNAESLRRLDLSIPPSCHSISLSLSVS